jgi:hypothetical protein
LGQEKGDNTLMDTNKNFLDYYTWTKRMIAKGKKCKTIKNNFIERYGKKLIPDLEAIFKQFNYFN